MCLGSSLLRILSQNINGLRTKATIQKPKQVRMTMLCSFLGQWMWVSLLSKSHTYRSLRISRCVRGILPSTATA